jgi:altronate dehydratase
MSPVVVVNERDNVATALEALAPGVRLEAAGHLVLVREAIPGGHKVALVRIARGEAVIKYGNSIGAATADIEAGMHVHVHNVAGARGRGDLRP